MIKSVVEYLTTLSEQFGAGWNRFWFAPSDPLPLCVLRIAVGLLALGWQLSWTPDLVNWFGPSGLLSTESVQYVVTGGLPDADFYHPSYFHLVSTPTELMICHAAGALVLVLFTLGLFTRVTSLLALVVVLSHVHRAPIIAGQFEPVLTMMIAYLCLGPAGTYLSLDRRLGRVGAPSSPAGHESWTATISLRLLQVHLSALYLMMGLTKLGGETWWAGEAMWWLMAQTESRLVDVTFLRDYPYVINAWTHAIVAFELAFGILIWNRLARPLLIAVAVLMWTSLALVTGLVSFCLLMIVACLAFVPAETVREWTARRSAPISAGSAGSVSRS